MNVKESKWGRVHGRSWKNDVSIISKTKKSYKKEVTAHMQIASVHTATHIAMHSPSVHPAMHSAEPGMS